MRRKRVIIESPFHSDDLALKKAYKLYLARCIYDSIKRKEAPFASHGFYTLFLDDLIPKERETGMSCGFAWMAGAELVAVYEDFGVSSGMWAGVHQAFKLDLPVEHRSIGKSEHVR